jgi:DNA-binding protein HU-beta
MNKSDFIEKIAARTGSSRGDAEKFVNAFTDVVSESLKAGEDIALTGFGVFTVSDRAARTGVNPQKPGEKIQIPATRVPKFKAGKGLKDTVKGA